MTTFLNTFPEIIDKLGNRLNKRQALQFLGDVNVTEDELSDRYVINISGLPASAAEQIGIEITQANAFTALQSVRYDDGSGLWVLARADDVATLRQYTVESSTGSTFIAVQVGNIDLPGHGLTVGATYYLSALVDGAYTEIPPAQGGDIVQALFEVTDPNSIKVVDQAVFMVGEGGAGAGSSIQGNLTFDYSVTQTDTDPGSETWLRDGASPSSATFVNVSKTAKEGDVGLHLKATLGNDYLVFHGPGDAQETYRVTSTAQDRGTFVHYPVVFVAQGVGAMADADECGFSRLLSLQFKISLDDLSDVAITSPVQDDVLVYNGSQWVNSTINTGQVLNSSIVTGTTTTTALNRLENEKLPNAEKGAINGVCPLGTDGLVPDQYLSFSGTTYKGVWDANTNTPTLPTGSDTNGDFYNVSVGGTQDLGNGPVVWAIGDTAIYDDVAGAYDQIPANQAVDSVFGRIGTIVAVSGDYTTSLITGDIVALTTAELDTKKYLAPDGAGNTIWTILPTEPGIGVYQWTRITNGDPTIATQWSRDSVPGTTTELKIHRTPLQTDADLILQLLTLGTGDSIFVESMDGGKTEFYVVGGEVTQNGDEVLIPIFSGVSSSEIGLEQSAITLNVFPKAQEASERVGIHVDQANTFAEFDQVFFNGSSWTDAQASASTTLKRGTVINVTSSEFDVVFSGRVDAPSHGLATGKWYLSAIVPGSTTQTPPTTVGQWVQEAFEVDGTDTLNVVDYAPVQNVQLPLLGDSARDISFGTLSSGDVIQYDGANWVNVPIPKADAVFLVVNQVAHGLVALEQIYFNGTVWTKSLADAEATLKMGTVTAVADVDNFTVTFYGLASLGHAHSPGDKLYLSTTVLGGTTTTPSSTSGHYVQYSYQVLDAGTIFVGDYAAYLNP